MRRRVSFVMFFGLGCLVALGVVTAEEQQTRESTSAAPAYTDKEKEAFDSIYAERIKRARTKEAKLALAKEILAGADGSTGGLKYLMLVSAKDLARDAAELDLAVGTMERIVELNVGDIRQLLTELIVSQASLFDELMAKGRKARSEEEKDAIRRRVTEVASKLIDNAIQLAAMYRADMDFKSAEKAEGIALGPATTISSPKVGQLRNGILVSRTLQSALEKAHRFAQEQRPDLAVWHYLDAGVYAEAAKLKPSKPDETASLLIRVATNPAAEPPDILAAAKAWDDLSLKASGALTQIRLIRAAELYERCTQVGDELNRKVAKARLQAINQKLGDTMAALRKPSEWIYLADMQHESASVGFGSFKKITVTSGPASLSGKAFPTGLLAHAPSRVVYALGGRYRELSTYYGMAANAGGAASFQILCDGKSVFSSPGMWKQHTQGVQKPLVIDVTGVEKLELVTKAVAVAGAFSMWGDPKVR